MLCHIGCSQSYSIANLCMLCSHTCKCSLLRKENGTFAPAYMLADSRMERAGRTSKQTPEPPVSNSLTRSAAIIVIGDEILAAKVHDVNTPFLCSELRAIGWRVCKVWSAPLLILKSYTCTSCELSSLDKGLTRLTAAIPCAAAC